MFRVDASRNAIAFKKIRPKANCYRAYAMFRTVDLFGKPALTRVWGRIGAAKKISTEVFDDDAQCERRWDQLVRLRVRHGYTLDD